MSQCAIIGLSDNEEVQWLDMRLEERGAKRFLLDAAAPPRLRITSETVEAQGFDLSKLSSIFVRDLGLPGAQAVGASGRLDPEASHAALSASREHLASWNLLLEVLAARGVRVVNPVATHEIHALKPWECATHAAGGGLVPATVSGMAQSASDRLPASSSGQWIEKGLLGGRGYTEPFDPASPSQRPVAIQIQERIDGVNVRAFVVGMRVIGAAANHMFDGAETDSRRGVTRIQNIKLPPEAEIAAVDAAKRLAMQFSAIDFMLNESTKKFVLLECNSSPFFVKFEIYTGLSVTGALADYLVSKKPHFATAAPAATAALEV